MLNKVRVTRALTVCKDHVPGDRASHVLFLAVLDALRERAQGNGICELFFFKKFLLAVLSDARLGFCGRSRGNTGQDTEKYKHTAMLARLKSSKDLDIEAAVCGGNFYESKCSLWIDSMCQPDQ